MMTRYNYYLILLFFHKLLQIIKESPFEMATSGIVFTPTQVCIPDTNPILEQRQNWFHYSNISCTTVYIYLLPLLLPPNIRMYAYFSVSYSDIINGLFCLEFYVNYFTYFCRLEKKMIQKRMSYSSYKSFALS